MSKAAVVPSYRELQHALNARFGSNADGLAMHLGDLAESCSSVAQALARVISSENQDEWETQLIEVHLHLEHIEHHLPHTKSGILAVLGLTAEEIR